MEGYITDISFSEGTVYIDKVRILDGVPYYLMDDNTLGPNQPCGV